MPVQNGHTKNTAVTEATTRLKPESNDLYNRENLIRRSLERLDEECCKEDREDILKFHQFQKDKQNELLWMNRCLTALITLSKKLKKPSKEAKQNNIPFRHATENNIRDIFEGMDREGYVTPKGQVREYAGSTDEKNRKIIKLFYKVVYGQNKFYPDAVEWLSTKVRKLKRTKRIDANMFLTEDEMLQLIAKAPSLQKKAMFACGYECGGRPEEFLNLTNQDLLYDIKGIRVILRGKTGERAIRLAVYGSLLQQWLDIHPRKNEATFPLWISEATNFKNRKLGIRGWEKVIFTAMKVVAPSKNPVPYILRHSRATFLAKMNWKEAMLREFFGWSKTSDKPAIYIHLSGRDLDSDILALNGDVTIKREEHKIKTSNCIRCKKELVPDTALCPNCGLPTSMEKVYLEGIKNGIEEIKPNDTIKKELDQMKEQIKSMWSTIESKDKLQNYLNSMKHGTEKVIEIGKEMYEMGKRDKNILEIETAEKLLNIFTEKLRNMPTLA